MLIHNFVKLPLAVIKSKRHQVTQHLFNCSGIRFCDPHTKWCKDPKGLWRLSDIRQQPHYWFSASKTLQKCIVEQVDSAVLKFKGCQDSGQPASWCLANSEILEKVLKQLAHWYFFTSEWVWRWARRLDRSAKARLQWRQENGFSPTEHTEIHVNHNDGGGRLSSSWIPPFYNTNNQTLHSDWPGVWSWESELGFQLIRNFINS